MNLNPINRPKLGYWFYPSEDGNAPGGNQLDIVISKTPTLEHFDPERVILNVIKMGKFMYRIKIIHPWNFEHSYKVITGILEIVDRKGKKEEAFTFGGTLKIESEESITICRMTSTAPIMEMNRVDPLLMKFIEEIEILLAERSAALLEKHRVYEQHLAEVDPFKMYLACLQTLIMKYESSRHLEEIGVEVFSNFLHQERRRLGEAGLLPSKIPSIIEIL